VYVCTRAKTSRQGLRGTDRIGHGFLKLKGEQFQGLYILAAIAFIVQRHLHFMHVMATFAKAIWERVPLAAADSPPTPARSPVPSAPSSPSPEQSSSFAPSQSSYTSAPPFDPSSSSSSSSSSSYGTAFTESVATAAGPKASPRLAVIIASLVRHLHAFARDVNLTHDEWMIGIDFVCLFVAVVVVIVVVVGCLLVCLLQSVYYMLSKPALLYMS